MKLTAHHAIAAACVATAAAIGGWLGSAEYNQTPATEVDATARNNHVNENRGPKIPLPRPIEDVLTLTASNDTAKRASPGAAAESTPTAENIVPGGIKSGSAIERLWETNANQAWTVRATPLTRPNWYITGVVQRGDKTQVIVQFEGEPQPRFLKIGDSLPGGGKLAWVRNNAIGVITPDKKIVGVSVRPDEWEPHSKDQGGNAPRPTNKPGGTAR